MADSTAMTVDFLRARLLSERSVSRAAKERADELAKRVAELEEQVREVTAQRRQAERAAAEVFAILESQGFGGGHLSDADDDSGSDSDQDGRDEEEHAKSRGDTVCAEEGKAAEAEEDALSGGTAQPAGGLSWKGRSVSPRKARQLKHKHRPSYSYLLSSSSDSSSPKYRVGQSCRKNKRQRTTTSNVDGRKAAPAEERGDVVAAEFRKGRQDGSDCTFDGQDDIDGEVGGGQRSSGGDGVGQYVIRYEKDGEMERMLERQAELIGQFEEEEEAQREWEKQYNEHQNANKVAAEAEHKPCQIKRGLEHTTRNQGACRAENKVLLNGSLSKSPPQQTSRENGAQWRESNGEPDQSCAQTASISARESSTSSTVTRQNQGDPGDEISDGDSSGFNGPPPPPRHSTVKTPSERSPSSDTLTSKVSDWSSSHFHDQLDTHSYRPASRSSNLDVEGVLQALQRARISLRSKLSKPPVPPSQVMLALPAPGDDLKGHEHDYLPADGDESNSYRGERGGSSPARQEILALPAPEDYHETRVDLPVNGTGCISVAEKTTSSSPPREEILALPAPGDDYRREVDDYMKMKVPLCAPGLFRLPTDWFPSDQRMCSAGFSLGPGAAGTRHTTGSFSNPADHAHSTAATAAPTTSGDDSGFSAQQCYDLYSSLPTAGRCNGITRPDFAIRDTSLLSGISGLGDADLFVQRGIDYTISNKWML